VLLVHPSADLYGSDRVLVESVRALAGAGWSVTVLVGTDGPMRTAVEAAGARLLVGPVPVLRRAVLSPRGLPGFARELPPTARAGGELLRSLRPDVVYVNTVTLPAWVGLARRHRARVLCHVHEAEHALPAAVRTALAAPLLGAHRVVANSRTTRDLLARSVPGLARRTDVVYNGVAGPPAPPAPVRDRLDGRLRLVVVGRVSARKGTDVAVDALGRLLRAGVDAELAVVGDVFAGNEAFGAHVRDLAAAAGVGDRVTFRGLRSEVWSDLARCDVALVPSLGESFGNAAVEAMLARRPVVVSDTHGLDEIVRDGENGSRFATGDAQALAGAVRALVDDWDGARRRAEVAAEQAARLYSVERYRREITAAVEAVR
jgi:hypothetical protein